MMRHSLLLLVLLFAGSSNAQDPTPSTLVETLMSVWESGDTSVLDGIMSEDVVYEDKPNRRSLQGLEEAKTYVSHVHTWASGVEIEITQVRSSGNSAVAEWTMSATQSKPIPGRVTVATNRPIEIFGLTAIDVERGKIVRAVDYLDALGFVLQLGATVELPGGTRLGDSN